MKTAGNLQVGLEKATDESPKASALGGLGGFLSRPRPPSHLDVTPSGLKLRKSKRPPTFIL
jgi:hypothetical protein